MNNKAGDWRPRLTAWRVVLWIQVLKAARGRDVRR
jgi:hypothetical protein